MLKEEIKKLYDRCTLYESQMYALINISINNNLIFKNPEYTESPSSVTSDIIKQFYVELLGIYENILIEKAYPVGKNLDAGTRPLLVRFLRESNKLCVLRKDKR